MKTIGCFVSSHGYGHATRMSAVLSSLVKRIDVLPQIVTTVGRNIFDQSLANYRYHRHETDIGFCQKDAFTIDLAETVNKLERLLPYDEQEIEKLARLLNEVSLVICDISPLGIAVARHLDVPSVVIENFTWDWLYAQYIPQCPKIGPLASYLQQQFSQANYHIQTEPICLFKNGALHCPPIFRNVREAPEIVRDRLQPGSGKLVMITLGGIPFKPTFLEKLQDHPEFSFYFCGQDKSCRLSDNIYFLSRSTAHYHPDLINCADLVVFKSGYSTLAESYQTGTPSIIIRREGFAESTVIENFARTHLRCEVISEKNFSSGRWLELLAPLVSRTTTSPPPRNGADDVADFLLSLL